jgi:hypothetical protein
MHQFFRISVSLDIGPGFFPDLLNAIGERLLNWLGLCSFIPNMELPSMSERNFTIWHTMRNEFGQCSWALMEQDSACPFITVRTHRALNPRNSAAIPPIYLPEFS